jgi:hypothetical protein
MDEQNVNVAQTTEQTQATATEGAKLNPKDVLRDLSKEYGVNLFEETGLQQLKEKFTTTHNELETVKQTSTQFETQLKEYQEKEQEYQIKIEALGLGFKVENLEEVLALAKVNTKDGQTLSDGLKAVKEKYGNVFGGSKSIGTQHNDLNGVKPDLAKTEVESYMSKDPKYRTYYKK